MDIAARHPDPAERRRADGFVALLTPVVKAAFTDFGFETAVISQQVFGGHGYIREWGMEQFVRGELRSESLQCSWDLQCSEPCFARRATVLTLLLWESLGLIVNK